MKKKILSIILCLGIFSNLVSTYAQNYNPDFFPIGVWSVKGNFRSVDDFLYNIETAASYHHTSFSNLKAQGFNSAFLSYEPIGYTLDTILDIAEINDMKVIPAMNNLHYLISQSNEQSFTDAEIGNAIENDSINRIKNSSAILGYYLYDEPLSGWIDFNTLENARNILTNMTSDAPHPILSTWNDEQQMEYIDSYLNLDVLMMDAYPFEDGDAIGDISDYMPSYSAESDPPPFSEYINSVRENHCESQDRPMWVVIQAFGDLESPENGGYWRQVYPKEIRLQVYLSIMQGAKGLWYFLYESEYPYLLGMLDVSGQPTQRLTEVIAVNSEINAISETLLKLKVLSDQSGVSIDDGEVKIHFDNTSANLEKYIIAVNMDVTNSSNPTITIQKNTIGYDVHSIQNIATSQNISFSETTTEISFTFPIGEGSGAVIKLSNQGLSIDDLDINNQISLYPNPVRNILFVQHDLILIESYQIFDQLGKLVKNGNFPESKEIDVSTFSKGVYNIKLKTFNGVSFKKFIKL
jgi:hypothetical protein